MQTQIRYEMNALNYENIPGFLIAYWASKSYIRAFSDLSKMKDSYQMDCGIKTGNNDLFLRMWFEISKNNLCITPAIKDLDDGYYKWFKYNKGGGYRKWYGGYEYVVNLQYNAKEIKSKISKDTYRLRNRDKYFKEGILWPLIGDIRFSARMLNCDTLSDVASNVVIFDKAFDYELLSIMNSKVFNELLKFINSTVSYPIDSVANVPIKISRKTEVNNYAQINVELAKKDWDSFETSWDFKMHPLI